MKAMEIASMVCSILSLLSGGVMWLLSKKYPSVVDAPKPIRWLIVIIGTVFLLSGLLDFVFLLLL